MKPNLSIKTLILLSCFIIFSACKKEGNSFVEGHLYEAGNELALSNIEIRLVQTSNGGNDKYIGADYTDSEGHFKINFRKGPLYEYYYTVRARDYISITGGKEISKRKTHLKLYAMPPACARLLLKNMRSEEVVFSMLGRHSNLLNVKVKAGTQLLTSAFSIEAFSENPFQWRYKTLKDSSIFFDDTLPSNSKTDTVYRTIEVK